MAKQKPAPKPKPVFDGKTVCKEGDFEVRLSDSGRACALWTNWGEMFDSLDKLKEAGILNVHERQLLEFGVIR